MASKRSKAMDQQRLSRAELRKDGEESKLRLIIGGISSAFKAACCACFGARWYSRLSFSAGLKKRSPLGYAVDVLLK